MALLFNLLGLWFASRWLQELMILPSSILFVADLPQAYLNDHATWRTWAFIVEEVAIIVIEIFAMCFLFFRSDWLAARFFGDKAGQRLTRSNWEKPLLRIVLCALGAYFMVTGFCSGVSGLRAEFMAVGQSISRPTYAAFVPGVTELISGMGLVLWTRRLAALICRLNRQRSGQCPLEQ